MSVRNACRWVIVATCDECSAESLGVAARGRYPLAKRVAVFNEASRQWPHLVGSKMGRRGQWKCDRCKK
jgi:hypothetical protein